MMMSNEKTGPVGGVSAADDAARMRAAAEKGGFVCQSESEARLALHIAEYQLKEAKDPETVQIALRYLEASALFGNAQAQYELAIHYADGLSQHGMVDEPINLMLCAANSGIVGAMCDLGDWYWNAFQTEESKEDAVLWWLEAADKGSASASLCLWDYYQAGGSRLISSKHAEYYLKRAAELGSTQALIEMKRRRMDTRRLEGKLIYEDALRFLRYAESRGDYKKVRSMLNSALKYGCADAFIVLGDIYLDDKSEIHDTERAIGYYRTAVRLSLPEADVKLAYAEFVRDRERSRDSGQKNGMKHHVSPTAQQVKVSVSEPTGVVTKREETANTATASSADNKRGTVSDPEWEEAYGKMQRDKQARLRNHLLETLTSADGSFKCAVCTSDADAREFYRLSLEAQRGQYKLLSKNKAFCFLKSSADWGYPAAQYQLALYYIQEGNPKVSQKEVFELFRKSAGGGYVKAQYLVGMCYARGSGVEQSVVKAIPWWRKAASNKHASAAFALAMSYLYGQGVAQSESLADYWLRCAVTWGDADACEFLNRKRAGGLFGHSSTEEHQKQARECYQEAMDYLNGTPETERDPHHALAMLHQAQRDGFVPAYAALGDCYLNGWGTNSLPKRAAAYYHMAIDRGVPYVEEKLKQAERAQAKAKARKSASLAAIMASTKLPAVFEEQRRQAAEFDYEQWMKRIVGLVKRDYVGSKAYKYWQNYLHSNNALGRVRGSCLAGAR